MIEDVNKQPYTATIEFYPLDTKPDGGTVGGSWKLLKSALILVRLH